jgi:hypothetical protein
MEALENYPAVRLGNSVISSEILAKKIRLSLTISWKEVTENQVFIISSYLVCSFVHSLRSTSSFILSTWLYNPATKTLIPMCILLVVFHSSFPSVHSSSPFLIRCFS